MNHPNRDKKTMSQAAIRQPARDPSSVPADIEIARNAQMKPIQEIGDLLDIPDEALHTHGKYIAKLDPEWLAAQPDNPNAKLVLVTAISPTPAGEGKTTTTVGLGDGMRKIGKKSAICLREPSLGPSFGMKGGAAGGGYAQVVPMENINLHFTGDFNAIEKAHNLLSALIDNHIFWGNALDIDVRRISWKRVMDMNDRALRNVTVAKGGINGGFPREDGFDITVASEIMAIFCLSENLKDLQQSIDKIIIGYNRKREPIYAGQLDASGAMSVLMKEALMPNLVQTLENNPAIIHGGPFANIAHGCNSVIATKAAMKLNDYVITEAGFGADLGAEKFFDIKCRKAGLSPNAVVLVATARALKHHGGVEKADYNAENVETVKKGLANLGRHLDNIAKYRVPAVVCINRFTTDTDAEMEAIADYCKDRGVDCFICTHWSDGGDGTTALATRVAELADSGQADFTPLYADNTRLWEKIRIIAREIYGADDAMADDKIRKQIRKYQDEGFGDLPVCMAKTQYSFSSDPRLRGAPTGHMLPVREVRLSAGAGFLVVICGDIMTMPGLPREPAAKNIYIDDQGRIEGLS